MHFEIGISLAADARSGWPTWLFDVGLAYGYGSTNLLRIA